MSLLRRARLQVEHLLARRGAAVAAVLLVVGVLGLAAAGWIYTHPGTTRVAESSTALDVQAETHTSGLITGDNTVYPAGQRVQDRPVYFRASTSDFRFSAVATPQTAERGGEFTQRIAIRRTASRDGNVFYRDTRVLASASARNASVQTTASLDIAAIENRTAALEQRIGDAGSVSERLVVSLSYQTPRYEGTKNATATIERGETWFDVATPTLSVTRDVTTTRVHASSPDWRAVAALGGAGALCVLVALLVAGLYWRRYRDAEPEPYREALVALVYREWISEGTAPSGAAERTVHMDSLVDLVDVAIDTDRRVVHDTDAGTYYVIDDAATYTYTPSRQPVDVSTGTA